MTMPDDHESVSDFVAAMVGKGDSTGPSHPDPDTVAEEAITAREKLEFRQSDHDSLAAFQKDRNWGPVASVNDPGEYHKAMASRSVRRTTGNVDV